MKNIITRFLMALTVVLCLAPRAHAQTFTLCFTTLNGAISATATSLVLTSAGTSTGCSFGTAAAGQFLWMDAELIPITAVSSTTMTVRREPGNRPTPHANGVTIFRGPGNAFQKAEPPLNGNWTGSSNAGCSAYPAPWINVNTANIWWCNRTNNQWSGTNFRQLVYGSTPTAQ